MYFRLQVRAITPKISDRRLGEEGGGGVGGCRTVHHQISTNVTSLGFWGSPPWLAFACNPSSVVAVRGGSGGICRAKTNTADLWHTNKIHSYIFLFLSCRKKRDLGRGKRQLQILTRCTRLLRGGGKDAVSRYGCLFSGNVYLSLHLCILIA